MATMKLYLENGFFVKAEGRYIYEVGPTRAIGNGWTCTINEDGSIECLSEREYSDGWHSVRYTITENGLAKLTLRVPYQPVVTLKKGYVLPRGRKLSDGVIGLAGGYIDERYAYFRDSSFENFLKEHGISAVKHKDPNGLFYIRNARYGGGECESLLLTDGNKADAGYDTGRTNNWQEEFPMTSAYEQDEYVNVSGASWTIHKQTQHERDCHNCFSILYTLEDPMKLVGLPKLS